MKLINWVLKKEYLFLGIIVIFFLYTRLYRIGSIPQSVYWDEASIGYNAYSVSINGKDEWGDFLPIHFRAFGEFKLPVYIYSVVPFVKILGLNAASVRIPSVVYSLASLILIYLIVKKITGNWIPGVISAFLFLISPWYFIFSRAGYETTAGVFFFLLGIFFYFKSDKRLFFLPLAFISFIASLYSYNSFRIIVPLTVVFILSSFIYRLYKKSFKNDLQKKWILYFSLSALFLALSYYPIYRLYKFDYGGARAQVVSVFGSTSNKFAVINEIARNYLKEYSYNFLIKYGDTIKRSQIPDFGEIFPITIPFLLIGIYFAVSKRNSEFLMLIFLLVIAPIPSAITKEAPHALRSILMAPLITIFSAIGIYFFYDLLKKYKNAALIIVILLFITYFANYFYKFIGGYNNLTERDWQSDYKKILVDYRVVFESKSKVIITSDYGQPYIFALFYYQYDPELFRSSVVHAPVDKWGFLSVSHFDKFYFKEIEPTDINAGNIVFASPDDKPEKFYPNSIVKYLDGSPAFYVYNQ